MAWMTRERWVGLAVIVITVLLTMMVLALLERANSQVDVCVTGEQRDHIRAVMLKAIDNALDDQVGNLFGNWVKEPSANQPKRAQTGTNNAIKAYILAKALIVAWEPAECSAGMQLQSASTKSWR
jgi:hypothetical protein